MMKLNFYFLIVVTGFLFLSPMQAYASYDPQRIQINKKITSIKNAGKKFPNGVFPDWNEFVSKNKLSTEQIDNLLDLAKKHITKVKGENRQKALDFLSTLVSTQELSSKNIINLIDLMNYYRVNASKKSESRWTDFYEVIRKIITLQKIAYEQIDHLLLSAKDYSVKFPSLSKNLLYLGAGLVESNKLSENQLIKFISLVESFQKENKKSEEAFSALNNLLNSLFSQDLSSKMIAIASAI